MHNIRGILGGRQLLEVHHHRLGTSPARSHRPWCCLLNIRQSVETDSGAVGSPVEGAR